jgi:hypothetical protein
MKVRHDLICMRLADMTRPHPEQDNSRTCSLCGEVVGIYPGGQSLLRSMGDNARIICQQCYADQPATSLAPGPL